MSETLMSSIGSRRQRPFTALNSWTGSYPTRFNSWTNFPCSPKKGVLAMNPAREVKTERFSRTEGKTPAFVDGEVQRLLDAVDPSTHTGLRDRALLGVLAYTFARIGAVVNLKVEDYYPSGKRF